MGWRGRRHREHNICDFHPSKIVPTTAREFFVTTADHV